MPINIVDKVNVTISGDGIVTAAGPNGTLSYQIHPSVEVVQEVILLSC